MRLLCRRKAKSTAVSFLSLACIVTSIVILRNITTYWPHRLILFATSGLQRPFPESSVLDGDTDSKDSLLERLGRGGERRRLEPRAVCKGLDAESTLKAEVEDLLCLVGRETFYLCCICVLKIVSSIVENSISIMV